jgi:hypothetical protein
MFLLPAAVSRLDMWTAVLASAVGIVWLSVCWWPPDPNAVALLAPLAYLLLTYCAGLLLTTAVAKGFAMARLFRDGNVAIGSSRTRQHIIRFLVVATFGLAGMWISIHPRTLTDGRIWLSTDALGREAQSVLASGKPDFRDRWIGLVHVHHTGLLCGNVLFQLDWAPGIGYFTLAYNPARPQTGRIASILGPGWRFGL